MAATRIISVIGRKNAGKTTLAVALTSELSRRGHRVMTIKHGHHPADVDRAGSDTWRHFQEGHAERVLIASLELRVLFERTPDDYDPIGLARQYMHGADIVLTEGYKAAPLPKIEVFRRAAADHADLRSRPPRTPASGWRSSPTTRTSRPSAPCSISTTPSGSSCSPTSHGIGR